MPTKEEIERVAKIISDQPVTDEASVRKHALDDGMLPTAVDDIWLRYQMSGAKEPFLEWLPRVKAGIPHMYPPKPIDDGISPELIERACGKSPTLAARAELYRTAGPELYNKILTSWGGSPVSLKPGTNPKAAAKTTEQKTEETAARKPKASNPWSKEGWNVTAQGRLVQSIGFEKASAIAAAAGSKIGATKFNPDYA
jgi:hypothetical protein